MASSASLLLALTPFTHEASPLALGLGNEQLVQTEGACGSFCLSSSNSNFDIKGSAHAATAVVPQQTDQSQEGLSLSPTKVNSFGMSWHPYYDFATFAGYRSSNRSTERELAAKAIRRIRVVSDDIPLGFSARIGESFSIGGRYILRRIEVNQDALTNTSVKTETLVADPNRWAVDALWQKDDHTGFGVSYTAPTAASMTRRNQAQASANIALPRWTDPQEFTASIAKLSIMKPPDGIVFGPFENVFHGTFSVVTWESGKPVSYSALASATASKDGWSLTDNGTQTAEFRFDTLDPSLSLSAGLESLWLRNSIGSLSTYTHIRMNHIASQSETNQWQGGFGFGLNSKILSIQASSLWKEDNSGYAIGVSSSL